MRKRLLLLLVFFTSPAFAVDAPTLPQEYIDTTYSLPTGGSTIEVNAGENFQTALNSAELGDVIVLEAGATFQGPFTLPNKTTGSGWIYIVSSNYSSLPSPGTRVSPSDAPNMPTLTAALNNRAVLSDTSAHHYRFVGIEFTPVAGEFLTTLIQIGNNDTSESTLPTDITFDRCYIHGDPTVGGRRGAAIDGIRVAVIDSYVSEFWQVGFDTQALWAYNTPGPIKIVNNYLEAAGENVMFGGEDPKITDIVPADIEVRYNYFFKPLAWQAMSGVVKNLFELKFAQRVLIEGNVFENSWVDSQVGYAILFTTKEGGAAPWVEVTDVTFRYNKIVNASHGFSISAQDGPLERISIENNLLIDIAGVIFLIQNDNVDLTFDHNTAVFLSNTHIASLDAVPPKNDGLIFTNNIFTKGDYGFKGSGTAEGTATLTAYWEDPPGWTFEKNALIAASSGSYPANNFFPADIAAVDFVDADGGNYRLAVTSTYKNAGTDSEDLGADIDALEAALAGVEVGPPGPEGSTVNFIQPTGQVRFNQLSGAVNFNR